MKKFAAFLLNNKGKKPNSGDAALTAQQQAKPSSSAPYSMAPLEHWDLEMHNACARGLKKAFKYLEENITPAHGKLLFQTSGLNTEVDQLINLIEDDTISTLDFSRMKSLHSLAYSILKVLSRHDPLIPSDLYDVLTSSHVDYESLLRHPRKQYLGLLEFIMNSLWRLVYEKKCDVSLDQVCKTIGTVLLRPQNEGMISFDDEDMFQTPEMQLRLATFSGILRCFRVDPVSPAQSIDRSLSSTTGKSLGTGYSATRSSVANSTPTASIQDRSIKLIFLDPENRPTEEQLMEVLTNFGEVTNIGFKNKFAVVLFAELEPALECALENDGHALGPDIKVKYLGAKELLDSHMKHLEEAFGQSSNFSSSIPESSPPNQVNQGFDKKNKPHGGDHYQHPSPRDDHPVLHTQNHTLPAEISAIHPYAGRSMADAGDHNISLNLSTDYRHAKLALDGYSSSSSSSSRQQLATRPVTAPAAGADSWKNAQRSTSRDHDSSHSSRDSWQGNRPQTAPTSSTTPHKTTKNKKKSGIAFEGDASPIPSHNSSRRNSDAHKHSPAKNQSPLQVKTAPGRDEEMDSSDIENENINHSTIVSPPSSNSSLRRQRQIKKIQVGVSPTASSSPSHQQQQSSPFLDERHHYDHPDDDASYLEEYPSPMLTQSSRLLKETGEEDANVLLSTCEFPPGTIEIADKNTGDTEETKSSPAVRRQSRSGSVGSRNSSDSNRGNNSRRSSYGSLLYSDKNDMDLRPKLEPPPNEAELDIVSYFATKIAKSMDRTQKHHDANYANSNPMPSLSKEYTSVKALFEVAEREYQDQITTLEAKCIVYQDKINQQETWLTAIEQRWQAELLQKQVHITTLETDSRQLREEIQVLKMEMQSKQARITSLETSSETLQRAVKMSKDRAQRDSLSVVLSQQQVISSLDENLEAIKAQNKRLQEEIDTMTIKHTSLIGENMQWKTKVAEWELKWNQFQQDISKTKVAQPENEDKDIATVAAESSDGEKNGKYFDGILVAAGKQSIVDSAAHIEDKEYRTMRALADHEIDEYMNNLPGRYHPVYSRDTVGIIRSETRDPNEHTAVTKLPAFQPTPKKLATTSSPPKYLKVKFDDHTENMTYSERLLANMTKHYRAGYRQTQYGGDRSLSPPDKRRSNLQPLSSSSVYHPYYQYQPTRNAAIAAAHMLPAASEIVPPERSQHTQYQSHSTEVSPPLTAVTGPPEPPSTLAKSLLPSSILNSPTVYGAVPRDTSILSPSALATSSSHGHSFSTNRAKSSYEDPMTAIKNYLAEKQLASTRADIGDSMQGMRFYDHLRAQFEHIDVPSNFGEKHHSSLPMSTNMFRAPLIAGNIGSAVGIKEDELWKLYV